MIEPAFALLGSASFTPRNRLLAALPHDVLSSLRPHLKPVSLPRGRVLCEADEPLERAYFVEVGAVSLVTVFENGTTAEMATVGREGMVGIGILLGGGHALGRYVVPVSGFAYAIETSRLRSALRVNLELAPPVRPMLRRLSPICSRTWPATRPIGWSSGARAGC